MVDVGVRQLRASRDRLAARGREAQRNQDGATAGLLFFYAAECGLKGVWLQENGATDTSDLPGDLRSHDLRALAKALRLSREASDALKSCRRRHGGQNPIECRDLHQAWRYGAHLESQDEFLAIVALQRLIHDCVNRR